VGLRAGLKAVAQVFTLRDTVADVYLKLSRCITTGSRGCIHKFPDWPPGARTANVRESV
jgi:hypothetical protein